MGRVRKRTNYGTSKIVHQVEVLIDNPDELSLLPKTRMVEGEKKPLQIIP